MPTDRQIAANRANARRSTGPRTAAGRARASRNALRHGLAQPPPSDPALAAQVAALTALLIEPIEPHVTDAAACLSHPILAAQFAEAQLELIRIRSARVAAIAAIYRARFDAALVGRLRSFERYERLARARRGRAKP
jgi:hypothetical protein